MTRLIHLTDLHFGAERADLVPALTAAIRALQPELVVVTGDLSHRGRPEQLKAALRFLQGLGAPFVTMPGNHDVPLFNLPLRLTAPFRNWHRVIGPQTQDPADAGPLRIMTANTADPWRWRRGKLRDEDLTRILHALDPAMVGRVPILACHHPLREPPGFDRGETQGARAALPALIAAGVQIVLTGHLHHWEIGLGITAKTPQPLLMVQSGTALCAREGEVDHGFSLLEFGPGRVTVTPHIAGVAEPAFRPRDPRVFLRRDRVWHLAGS